MEIHFVCGWRYVAEITELGVGIKVESDAEFIAVLPDDKH